MIKKVKILMLMLIVSWWFIVLIVNILFYDLIKNADEESTQTWLGLGLTAIDIILIVLMFRGI